MHWMKKNQTRFILVGLFTCIAFVATWAVPSQAQDLPSSRVLCRNVFSLSIEVSRRESYEAIANANFWIEARRFVDSYQNGENGEAVRVINGSGIAEAMYQRLLLLRGRSSRPQMMVALDAQMEKVDGVRDRLDWTTVLKRIESGRAGHTEMEYSRQLEAARVFVYEGRERISPEKRAQLRHDWQQANALAMRWAVEGRDLTLEMVQELNRTLRASEEDPALQPPGELLNAEQANFYEGRNGVNPQDALISGSLKLKATVDLVNYVNRQIARDKDYITLAAIVRQMFISIQPFSGGNLTTAHLLADYILVRDGYPPAIIPPELTPQMTSKPLLPLRSYEEQVPPDLAYAVIVDGLTRSYLAMGFKMPRPLLTLESWNTWQRN